MIMICTYPRSGSHFLFEVIKQEFGKIVPKNHWKVYGKDFYIISIIRDPEDTICSLVSMRPREDNIEEQIQEAIQRYIMFYNYILDRADLVFEFEDLTNNTDYVVKKIKDKIDANKFIEYSNYNFSHFTISDNFGKLESSKSVDKYKKIKDAIKLYDLQEAYRVYLLVKDKINDK